VHTATPAPDFGVAAAHAVAAEVVQELLAGHKVQVVAPDAE
jgi:hypothetical protein